ncbi:hypothetical protein ACIP2Y_44530 [Streptomyces sviceus]|uniref:hypothetical protein n=1 Tax=Streptomyces sviceus TaxID=285530 RepID=UPI003808E4DC
MLPDALPDVRRPLGFTEVRAEADDGFVLRGWLVLPEALMGCHLTPLARYVKRAVHW